MNKKAVWANECVVNQQVGLTKFSAPIILKK